MKFNKKNIIRLCLLSLGAFIVGINLYFINAAKLSGNQVPMPFGIGSSVVLSGSMEPTLSTGDLIFIKERDSYKENEVIVFQDGNIAVVHRIISIDGDYVITQGDANNTPDDPILMGQIKGEVVGSIPLVGYLVNLIKNPISIILIIGLMVYFLEKSYIKDKEEKDKDLEAIKEEIRKLKEELY